MLRLVINLDRSPDRLSWMQEQFQRLELDFNRVSAVDGSSLSELDLHDVARPRVDGLPWSPGEVACFLSHRNCWKIASKATESHIAIFEDDIHLAAGSERFLKDPSWVPDTMDIVKLETNFHETRLGILKVRVGDHYLSEIKARHWGSAGYIIKRSTAARLLELSSSFDRVVDEFLFDPWKPGKRFNCYQLDPAICIQDFILKGVNPVLPSVIDEDRMDVRGIIRHDGSLPPKRKGLEKLKRELMRPVRQFGRGIVKAGRLILFGEKIVEVPYGRQGNSRRRQPGLKRSTRTEVEDKRPAIVD